MIKFDELKQELDKVIELALEIKNNQMKDVEEDFVCDLDLDDLSETKEEKCLINYLKTLTEDKVHALMSIMYFGRDGYWVSDGNADDILSYYIKSIDKEEKDIEISVMLGKIVLHDYLVKGRSILTDRNIRC